jgi:serine/threonine protein phosphatase 1
VPDGVRVYAIGDVHGCLAEFERLLDEIDRDSASLTLDTHLVLVGDLIDRGPDSAGVLQRVIDGPLPCKRQSFLMGNHEEAMLEVLRGDSASLLGWLRYGGSETLESYGLSRAEIFQLGAALPDRMCEVVPESHIQLMESFEDQLRIGDYLFVHAGIRPGVPLDQQQAFDLRWIREEFLSDDESDHGVVVVHGHTISEEPVVRPNRIGIDTGCFASGRLTALILEGEGRRFLQTRGKDQR